MKIGVLSDTHSLNLPQAMLAAFSKVDFIIHAGDICDADVLKELKEIAPVKAVHGNMDDQLLKKKLPLREVINVDGVIIGVTHGHVGETRDAQMNALAQFEGDKIDVIIYGHSHHAVNQRMGDRLVFNPGSPNDVIKARYFSYGILTIESGAVKGEIIKI